VVTAPTEPVPVAPAAAALTNPIGDRIVALAERQLGAPYRYGGATPQGFDCSGLVFYVFEQLGVRVPRTAEQQLTAVARIAREALQPGDLVFFWLPQAHVGIYAGNGEFIHAPATGRAVERARLDQPLFILGFAGGGRFPP
jgi:cell wall-associated NlpC family hydrolase